MPLLHKYIFQAGIEELQIRNMNALARDHIQRCDPAGIQTHAGLQYDPTEIKICQ